LTAIRKLLYNRPAARFFFSSLAMSIPNEAPQFAANPIVAELAPDEREKMRRVAGRQQFVLYALLANIVVNIMSWPRRP